MDSSSVENPPLQVAARALAQRLKDAGLNGIRFLQSRVANSYTIQDFIDDGITPTIFHGYGPDALTRWNKNSGTYKGPFDTHEAAVEWLASLCDRLAERYRKAAERYRFTMRQIAEDRAADLAASGSPNVAEAACEVDAEELNHEGNQ